MNIRAKIYGGTDPAEEPLIQAKRPKGAKADTLHSVKVSRETCRASNGRSEDRHRLTDEQVRITHGGTDHEVELINLSGGGAMITGALQPMLWDRVDLHLGEHGDIECAVRWIREGRIGLEFAHETRLDWPADQVAIVLRHVIARTFPHITFNPDGNDEPLSCEPPRPDEHRVARRHPLIWMGVLHHDYQSTSIRVRNISETGAMIESEVPVRVGTQPLLELAEAVSISATVQWAIGDQVGLSFNEPFDMSLLAESRPTVATNDWTPPAYLDPDRQDEDRWGRLTLHQLHQELEGFLKH